MTTALTVHDSVWTKLDAIAGINAYDGEVPATPPLDADGRVHAYAVLYASPGALFASTLAGAQTSMLGSFQVTCVGGDPTRTVWCVDKVRTALAGATVTLDGQSRIIRVRSEDPGPVRRDDDVRPPRHYVPLEFQLFAP
jgi:hypothetical protein